MTDQRKLPAQLLDLIAQQKEDLQQLLLRPRISREVVPRFRESLPSNLIKVILGPRRAGKSTCALELLEGRDYSYVNFDDENLLSYLRRHDTTDILPAIRSIYGPTQFIVLDEIQNVAGWEVMCNRLQRAGCNLVITGSNSKLLSDELATHLTGRHVPLLLLPFSWAEFKTARPQSTFENYLQFGGFPEVVVNNVEQKSYLGTLTDSIILKDIVGRHAVRFVTKLRDLFSYLSTSFTKEYSLNKLAHVLEFASKTTLKKYISFLGEAYLICELTRFSFKVKEQLSAPKKIYLIDNGLANEATHAFDTSSKRLENYVFLDLLRSGLIANIELFYYKTKSTREIDFVVKQGAQVDHLIQVAYSLAEHTTLDRECQALIDASNELHCDSLWIVSLREQGIHKISGKTIRIITAEQLPGEQIGHPHI